MLLKTQRALPITDYRQASALNAEQWITSEAAVHANHVFGKVGLWERSAVELIGMAGLTPRQHGSDNLVDLTYRLRSTAWLSGYGAEPAIAMAKFSFETLDFEYVCHRGNRIGLLDRHTIA